MTMKASIFKCGVQLLILHVMNYQVQGDAIDPLDLSASSKLFTTIITLQSILSNDFPSPEFADGAKDVVKSTQKPTENPTQISTENPSLESIDSPTQRLTESPMDNPTSKPTQNPSSIINQNVKKGAPDILENRTFDDFTTAGLPSDVTTAPTTSPTSNNNSTVITTITETSIAPNTTILAPTQSPLPAILSFVSLPSFQITLVFPSSIGEDIVSLSSPIFTSSLSVLEDITSSFLKETLDEFFKNDVNVSTSDGIGESFSLLDANITISPIMNTRYLRNSNINKHTHVTTRELDETVAQQSQESQDEKITTGDAEIERTLFINGQLTFDETSTPDDDMINNALFDAFQGDRTADSDEMPYLELIESSTDSILSSVIGLTVMIDDMGTLSGSTKSESNVVEINESTPNTAEEVSPSRLFSNLFISVIIVAGLVVVMACYTCFATYVCKCYKLKETHKNKNANKSQNTNTPKKEGRKLALSSCVLTPCAPSTEANDSGSIENEDEDSDNDTFAQELELSRIKDMEEGVEISRNYEDYSRDRGKHVTFEKNLEVIDPNTSRGNQEQIMEWVDADGTMQQSSPIKTKTQTSASPNVDLNIRPRQLFDVNETFTPDNGSTQNSPDRVTRPVYEATETFIPIEIETPKKNSPRILNRNVKLMNKAREVHTPEKNKTSNSNFSEAVGKFEINKKSSIESKAFADFNKFENDFEDPAWDIFSNTDSLFKPNVVFNLKQRSTIGTSKSFDDNSFFKPNESFDNAHTGAIGKAKSFEDKSLTKASIGDGTLSTTKDYFSITEATQDTTKEYSVSSNNELKLVSDVLHELKKVSKFLSKRLGPETTKKLLSDVESRASTQQSIDMKSTIKTVSTITDKGKLQYMQHLNAKLDKNMELSMSDPPKDIDITQTGDIQASVMSSLGGFDESRIPGKDNPAIPPESIEVKWKALKKLHYTSNKQINENDKEKVGVEEGSTGKEYIAFETPDDSVENLNDKDTVQSFQSSAHSLSLVTSASATRKNQPDHEEPSFQRAPMEKSSKAISRYALPPNKESGGIHKSKEHEKEDDSNEPPTVKKTASSKGYKMQPTISFADNFLDQEMENFFHEAGSHTTKETGTTRSMDFNADKFNSTIENWRSRSHVNSKKQLEGNNERNVNPYLMNNVKSDLSAVFTVNTFGELVDKNGFEENGSFEPRQFENESYVSAEDEILFSQPPMNQDEIPSKVKFKLNKKGVQTETSKFKPPSSETSGTPFLKAKDLIPMFEKIHPGTPRPPLHPNSESLENSLESRVDDSGGKISKQRKDKRKGSKPFELSISSIQYQDSEPGSSIADARSFFSGSGVSANSPGSYKTPSSHKKINPPPQMIKSPAHTAGSSQSSFSGGFVEKEVESLFSETRLTSNRSKVISVKDHPPPHDPPTKKHRSPTTVSFNVSALPSQQSKNKIENRQPPKWSPQFSYSTGGRGLQPLPEDIAISQPKLKIDYSSSTDTGTSEPLSGGGFPSFTSVVSPTSTHASSSKPTKNNTMTKPLHEKTIVTSNKSGKFAAAAGKVINTLKDETQNNYKKFHTYNSNDFTGDDRNRSVEKEESDLKASALISMFEKKVW